MEQPYSYEMFFDGGKQMLFEGLNKLKRSSIMAAIILMAAGVILMICPEQYVPTLINVVGVLMLIGACVMVLDFIGSKKSLINYILLTIALALGIVGGVVLMMDIDTVFVIAILFGIGLLIDGVYSIVHALVFARRSGRRGWWIMVILSALLILCGLVIANNPAWHTPDELLKITGLMVVFASVVSIIRLIWIWPIKTEKE